MYKLARFSYELRSFSRYLQSIAKENICDFRYEFIEKQTVKVRHFRKKIIKWAKHCTFWNTSVIKVDIFGQLLCNFMPMQIIARIISLCGAELSLSGAAAELAVSASCVPRRQCLRAACDTDYKVSIFLCIRGIIWILRNGLLLNSVHMIYITCRCFT